MYIVLDGTPLGTSTLTRVAANGTVESAKHCAPADLAEEVRQRQSTGDVRWVWGDTRVWYPVLLAAGVTVERCTDLRLCHRILAQALVTADSALARMAETPWPGEAPPAPGAAHHTTLFDDVEPHVAGPDAVAQFAMQRAALDDLARRDEPAAARLQLLLAAESTGALIAEEMRHTGLPWRVDVHRAVLEDVLGPRPVFGGRPVKLEALADEIRMALDAPTLNPDSQQDVLRALGRAGLAVSSTSKWELQTKRHPVIAPLLEYKKRARLLSANGWAWMDEWIRDGRFHPEYVVGGVVTGRWATRGGGALQLPARIRGAVRADDGWVLVVADAAQLEPRIIAAMSHDERMAEAGRSGDLYQAFVDAGIVDTRDHAKVAMLGALYGATTGESGALMPRLARAFPRAIALVENAARAGERGEQVSTWLGRSSPLPGKDWSDVRSEAAQPAAGEAEERLSSRLSRDWGRFTRNFVAQGTAAEWALCWMAGLRQRLRSLDDSAGRPHLAYFLHDEVIVHTPAPLADDVSDAIRTSAAAAGRLMFGDFPVDFALSVSTVESYADAT
ncbi:bifunctional 3'-5' exonuclease/DNA polymerase [Okibacterium endophyticum]